MNTCISTPSRRFTRKNLWQLLLLIAAGGFLIFLILPSGYWFGSETDWYSQHMTIADYMRKNFYATGQLFPDFTGLGGGTNFFSLSYYGFMRPDVLISYFFPNIPIAYFIQGYAILEILAGGGLLYYWLHKKGFSDFTSFVCGFFYLTANCFFQAHRQIMFVNYLPFLILAFLCLDQILSPKKAFNYRMRPHAGLVFSLFFCILHSFYFFPSCFVACILYICHLQKSFQKYIPKSCQKNAARKVWLNFILDVSFAVSMNFFLLLPTGLAILGNKKDTGEAASLLKILGVNPTLDSILYSPYGCGLSVFCLYALFLCIREKKTRKLAVTLFVFLFFDIFYWILNATLYVRPKSMIPFLPLILYLVAHTIEGLRKKEISHSPILALLCAVPVAVQLNFSVHAHTVRLLILADFLVLLILVFFSEKQRIIRSELGLCICSFLFLCTTPALLYVVRGQEENFAPVSDNTRDSFSQEELLSCTQNSNTRFDVLEHPSGNSNYVSTGDQNKSTLYSSISNSHYNTFLYDLLKMPISIRNRVAMVADSNPFQEYLMGVRYIQTRSDKVPAGYEILQEKNGHVLAENQNVLPLAYGSTALLAEEKYDQLTYPVNLDTLINRTIVPEDNSGTSTVYQSQMTGYQLPDDFFSHKPSEKNVTMRKELLHPLTAGTILLLSFDVDYTGEKDVSIVINGIRNRLSSSKASYPNNNTTFTYQISANETLDALEVTFSPGNYQIKNATAYTLPLLALSHPGIVEFHEKKATGKQLLNGSIQMPEDGYFVTSYTFSSGYKAIVDGKEITPTVVNKAFVGFPLEKGAHEITLEFQAPGKALGFLFSGVAAGLLLLIVLIDKMRFDRSKRRARSLSDFSQNS